MYRISGRTLSFLALVCALSLSLGCEDKAATSAPDATAQAPASDSGDTQPDMRPGQSAPEVSRDEANGLMTVTSQQDFDATYAALRAAIEDHDALTILAEVDHTKNAADNTDMTLHPARVIFFGNPNLGTPLMKAAPTMGLDLPQRMLVVKAADDQPTTIVYNDPMWLATRHGLTGQGETLTKIAGALEMLSTGAASAP